MMVKLGTTRQTDKTHRTYDGQARYNLTTDKHTVRIQGINSQTAQRMMP